MNRGAFSTWRPLLWMTAAMLFVPVTAFAAGSSLHDTSVSLPTWEQLTRLFSLRDYNTRVVLFGTTLLGLSAGVVGTFMLLRKRALMGDAASHATLPGICIAFMVMTVYGGTGKAMVGLLIGAAISGFLGMLLILFIRNTTRLKEDAALGIVLSVFFGIGVALLGIIQKMKTGSAAGLESFIYGKTASMLAADAQLIAVASVIVVVVAILLFKEFTVLCFDEAYAGSQGWPIITLDVLMLGLIIAVTVIGLQAVGLILVIALLIIPSAAARFWTDELSHMVVLAGAIGAVSGFLGAGLSAVVPRLPAGAIIVVVASCMFALSMVFGPARGVLFHWLAHRRLNRKVAHQHLLRGFYECLEQKTSDGHVLEARGAGVSVTEAALLDARSWTPRRLRRLLRWAIKEELLTRAPEGFTMTEKGLSEACRVVRNHRLWEMYLITHADIAPSHVDRDADMIEHVLGQTMVARLENLLATEYPELVVPPSPHLLLPGGEPAAHGATA